MKKTLLLKRILSYSGSKKKYVIFAILYSIISVGVTLALPVIIGNAVDEIIGVGAVNFSKVLINIAWIVGAVVVGFVSQWILSICSNSLSFYITQEMRRDFFNKVNSLPISEIDKQMHGNIVSKLTTDVEAISNGLLQGFTNLFIGITTILGVLALMLYINPLITIAVVVLTPLTLIATSFIAKRIHKQFSEQANIQGQVTGFLQEKLMGQKTVKALALEDESQQEFGAINSKLYECGVRAQFYSALTNPITRFINNIIYATVGIVGLVLSLFVGNVTAGSLTTFLMYANQYSKPFNEISGVIAELQSAFASAKRVFDFLDLPSESSEEGLDEITCCDGTIKIDNVSFGYSPDKILISDLSLDISKGQKVALVGKTGCGKTTFINLLMRFYELNSGKIYVSEKATDNVTRKSLRSCFGMVLQDSWLFGGSIKDNIAFGKPNAQMQEIQQAAIQANADEFIQKLPNGYDTIIQSGGVNLSEGQKQLLCIARIMLIQPPMLILDEATSNIDTRTELKINQAFDKLLSGKTSIIVAHRLTTIKSADLILVMKDGDIVESGNHQQLIENSGYYKQLYNSQEDAESI